MSEELMWSTVIVGNEIYACPLIRIKHSGSDYY